MFSSMAATLISTVPEVVAMQSAVTDDAAAVFSRALMHNRGIDDAIRAGRIALTGVGAAGTMRLWDLAEQDRRGAGCWRGWRPGIAVAEGLTACRDRLNLHVRVLAGLRRSRGQRGVPPLAWWMIQMLGSQYSPVSLPRSMCTVARPAGKT